MLRQTARVAPDFKGFFVGFRKLAKRSRTGLPALRTLLNTDLPPVLTQFSTFLRQVTPIIAAATRYKREITSFFGNITGATQAAIPNPETGNQPAHYLRTIPAPLNPEAFAVWPTQRLAYEPQRRVRDSRLVRLPRLDPAVVRDARLRGGCQRHPEPGDPDQPRLHPPGGARPSTARPRTCSTASRSSASAAAPPPRARPGPAASSSRRCSSIGEVSEVTDYLHVYQDAP